MSSIIAFIIKYRKLIYAGVFVALLAICGILIARNKALKEDNNRLENNQTALMSDIEEFKTKSGKDAVKIRELELTTSEFKKLCEEQKGTIEDLNIKVKRLNYLNSTGSNTAAGGKTELKDTVIIVKVDSVLVKDTIKHFVWQDPWNKIEGSIKDRTVDCMYYGNDTVTIAISRVPKRFLFFKYGTKYVEVTTVNSNPSSHVTYSKAIKIKK